MIRINQHLQLLGYKVRDRITGKVGVVTSVCFDLYGCIQALTVGEDGESSWRDVSRLEILSTIRVMELPPFNYEPDTISSGRKGGAEKPMPN